MSDVINVYHIYFDGPEWEVNHNIYCLTLDYAKRKGYRATGIVDLPHLIIELYFDSTYRDVRGVTKMLYGIQYYLPLTMMESMDRAFG